MFRGEEGFLREWVTEELKGHDPRARHVLVLDEINRCDTAAVLGELLQLLEYRETTIKLLSGRQFVFPRNLYIIGTMNSADRSSRSWTLLCGGVSSGSIFISKTRYASTVVEAVRK